MNGKTKRPIGVTLTAIAFLWIGCGGSLFFPILALTGSLSDVWSLALGSVIHSQPWLQAISYVLNCIWFLFYVAYAIIGFGLWKLKNWARKSVLGIFFFVIVAAIVVALIFVRPFLLGASVVGMTIFELGWLGWYLMRPRVQYAFGAWNRYSSTGEWIEPPGLTKWKKLSVSVLVPASLVVLSVIPLLYTVESMMRSSDAYKLTLTTAQSSPCVVSALGLPLESHGMSGGHVSESSTEGSAELRIPVRGPKSEGSLEVQAKKANGSWKIDSLVFTHGGIHSGIVPSEGDQACQ